MHSFFSRLVFLVTIAAALGGVYLYFEIGSMKRELVAQAEIRDALRAKFNQTTESLDDIKAKYEALADSKQKGQVLEERLRKLQNDLPPMQKELESLEKQFVDQVRRVRLSLTGTSLPDLTLDAGQTLQQVKLQKLNLTDVTVAHSGGIAKVPLSRLPANLTDSLRLGMPPMKEEMQQLAPEPAAASTPAPTVAAVAPKPLPARGLTPAEKDKIRHLEDQLKIVTAERQKAFVQAQTARKYMTGYHLKNEAAILAGKEPLYVKLVEKLKAEGDRKEWLYTQANTAVANLQIEIENIIYQAQQPAPPQTPDSGAKK